MTTIGLKLLELLQESVITQSLLVLCVFGPMAYCVIAGLPIPEVITQYGMIILGFFFGAKATYQVMKGASK